MKDKEYVYWVMELPRPTLEKMSKAELISLVLAQGEQIKLQSEQIKSLEKRVEELERKNARSAAPFSKNTRKKDPLQPGRKKGKGKFENRTAPDETAFTEIKDVELAATVCGALGGELED